MVSIAIMYMCMVILTLPIEGKCYVNRKNGRTKLGDRVQIQTNDLLLLCTIFASMLSRPVLGSSRVGPSCLSCLPSHIFLEKVPQGPTGL